MTLNRKTPLKPSGFKPRIKPLPGILRTAQLPAKAKPRVKRMKSSQRAVSAADKALWSALADLGCVACHADGNFNPYVSIHHIDGRTKPGCHQKVLALCAGHHQDGTGEDKSMIAVHPYKAQFEAHYGSQYELLEQTQRILKRKGLMP